MVKGVIYTAITNEYDVLKQPKVKQSLPMVCFQNNLSQNVSWQTQKIDTFKQDPIRTARLYKIHPHLLFPDYDWSIWVDGSLLITDDLINLLEEVINSRLEFGIYKHAKRNCLYQAAKNCIKKQKDDERIITQQINNYISDGYPNNNGLVASGVLVRKHNDLHIINLMNLWWKEICKHSRRDQISFNYVCWKLNYKYWEIPSRIGDGRYFNRNPHGI